MGFKARSLIITLALLLAGCTGHGLPAACEQKPSSGRCDDSLTRFYYDAGWQECRAFIWGGCQGSAPFETMRACVDTCDAVPDDLWQRQQGQATDKPVTP